MTETFMSDKTIIFKTLEKATRMLTEASPYAAQYFIEKELQQGLNTNPLPNLAQVDNNKIKKSKAVLNDTAKEILEKSRLPEELKAFMTPDLLTAITLTILTTLFSRADRYYGASRVSQTALIRAISDHFIRQFSLQRDKKLNKKETNKNSQR